MPATLGRPSPQSLPGHSHGHGPCRPLGRGLLNLVEAGFYVSGVDAKVGDKQQKNKEKSKKRVGEQRLDKLQAVDSQEWEKKGETLKGIFLSFYKYLHSIYCMTGMEASRTLEAVICIEFLLCARAKSPPIHWKFKEKKKKKMGIWCKNVSFTTLDKLMFVIWCWGNI